MNRKPPNKICEKCGVIHKGKYKKLCDRCYQNNFKLTHQLYLKEYYAHYNREKRSERAKYERHYREKHLEQIRLYEKTYREKVKNNPILKIKSDIRKHINNAVRRNKIGYIKNKHTEEILGCSIEQFKTYIASLFKEGMSWNNYGEWHLDHIKPISMATTEEEVYKLCHYTNYQPLWAKDNIIKGAKYYE